MAETSGRVSGRPSRGRSVASIAGAATVGIALLVAQSEVALITTEQNGEFAVSSYSLREDPFDHPRLKLLRRMERLDEVVSGARSQFETMVALRAWTHRQWQAGGRFYYPPWDAVEILDLARRFDNRGFCAQYAVVFLQACQSLGIHARYVDLPGHFVVAVWSDDFDRWVLMDPTNDVHYEMNGVPMRGRDLYAAYWSGNVRGVERVDSAGGRSVVTRDDLGDFRLYSIALSADQLSNPVEVKSGGAWKALVHAKNYRTYPKIGEDRLVIGSEFLAWPSKEVGEPHPQHPETFDQDDFRYALNQTIILLANRRVKERIVKIVLLSSNSPTFERFLVRSEASPAWVPSPSATIHWLIHPGRNLLSARIATKEGWRGSASDLVLYYKPALFESLPAFRGNLLTLLWHRSG